MEDDFYWANIARLATRLPLKEAHRRWRMLTPIDGLRIISYRIAGENGPRITTMRREKLPLEE